MISENHSQVRGLSGFRSSIGPALCWVDCDVAKEDRTFTTRFHGVSLGAAKIFRYEGRSPRSVAREAMHIRENPVDDFLIMLPFDLPFEMAHLGYEVRVEPGDFLVLSTAHAFEALTPRSASSQQTQTGFVVSIPGQRLRQRVPHIDQCCGRSLGARQGAAKIAKSMIQSLFEEGRALSALQASVFGSTLINLASAITLEAPELRGMFASRRETVHANLYARATVFIEDNLSNPQLDARRVAEHCHVSIRQLQAAFESAETTVSTLIRELRLRRCRAELADPALRKLSVTHIALKWGYSSAASFSRAYHQHFGVAPGRDRRVTQ